jgi:hypothetical protein
MAMAFLKLWTNVSTQKALNLTQLMDNKKYRVKPILGTNGKSRVKPLMNCIEKIEKPLLGSNQ